MKEFDSVEERYERYLDQCETADLFPMSFKDWLSQQQLENQSEDQHFWNP